MTRLTPPAQQTRLLVRQRVEALLADAGNYPLTLLVAPAGSGKTTALAGLAERCPWPVAWCRLSAADDALALVRHITAALRPFAPGLEEQIGEMLMLLSEPTKAYVPETIVEPLVSELVSALDEDTMLILDDYHYVDWRPELRDMLDHLIGTQPQRLHLVLAARVEPLLTSLPVRRARGEVLQFGESDLAFTLEETRGLWQLYDLPFTTEVAEWHEFARGWPLAVQMLVAHIARQHRLPVADPSGDGLVSENGESSEPALVSQYESLLPLLDEYLLRQVYNELPHDLQGFVLRTAELRWLDQEAYAALPGLHDIAYLHKEVERRVLFLETGPGNRLFYQPLFRGFLERLARQRLSERRDFHLHAARHYRTYQDYEGELYHLLAIGEAERAAEVLEQAAVAMDWIRHGRAQAVLAWLERLPEELRQRPALLEAHAAARRSLGNFERALQLYAQAEEAFQAQDDLEGQVRVLRGRAEVYLDTVQPAPAVALLRQALKLLPRDRYAERAEILRLQAENWANRGRADVALKLETCARSMAQRELETASPDEIPRLQSLVPISTPLLLSRLMLRSGRLNESLHQLEAELGLGPHDDIETASPMLAHREPSLLLAFVYTLLGKDARALAAARRGLLEAQQGDSQLTEAVAHMRVGHAYQVVPPLDVALANRHYQQALELVEAVGISRTRVEIYMGLALLYGHSGDMASAESVAQDALQIAGEAGDEWITALVWLALGGAAVVGEDERALEWLDNAYRRFVRGSDSYGQAVVTLWRALWYHRAGDSMPMTQQVARLLELVREHGYEGLLTAPTLFGPRDMAMLIPLLLQGRALTAHATYAQQLLRHAFPSIASDDMVEDYHPGYTLRIQMLGNFRVWRGIREVQGREWQREKARQLLQLLLTYRGQWLQREQICSWLWPDSDLDAAERQFKVTLNALNTALEPLRPPRTMPFFVRRQGLAYSFAPSYGCWIDVDEFELRTTSVVQGDEEFFLRNSQIAVQLYKGDYLAEALYDSWTLEERERLMARYLATATMLAERMMERGDEQQAVQLCERVLRRDRCYEEAYQVLMRVYARSGSRSQALRTYGRCEHALQDELGIDPLPETSELYEQIKRNEKV
jgi:DNA-binding SARP family transcriptional activator